MKDFLRGLPLFSDLDNVQLDRLAGRLRIEHAPAYQTLFRQGEPVEALVIVREGAVVVLVEGNDSSLSHLSAGRFFAEPGLLNDKARHYATVRTATPAVLWRLSKGDLMSLLGSAPGLELKLRAEISRQHGQHVAALLGLVGQRDVRIPVDCPVMLNLEGGSRQTVELKTLSLGGLALEGAPPSWEVGQLVKVDLRQPGSGLPLLAVSGTVVWRDGETAGVAFGPDAAGDVDLVYGVLRSLLGVRR